MSASRMLASTKSKSCMSAFVVAILINWPLVEEQCDDRVGQVTFTNSNKKIIAQEISTKFSGHFQLLQEELCQT